LLISLGVSEPFSYRGPFSGRAVFPQFFFLFRFFFQHRCLLPPTTMGFFFVLFFRSHVGRYLGVMLFFRGLLFFSTRFLRFVFGQLVFLLSVPALLLGNIFADRACRCGFEFCCAVSIFLVCSYFREDPFAGGSAWEGPNSALGLSFFLASLRSGRDYFSLKSFFYVFEGALLLLAPGLLGCKQLLPAPPVLTRALRGSVLWRRRVWLEVGLFFSFATVFFSDCFSFKCSSLLPPLFVFVFPFFISF